ncbi:PEP-utilising enzyme, mobile domain [Kibdelosporangium aridum]|uniref:PEP-utilising enzyme, mobile domain n=2 Tax=Kibdelosporangium aridum TaxID=2030 RepID=A0A1W2FR55_KIBAR|nr:PEP-utilising enzyme, mobile domain [Kibdelosporangium aridum]
MWTAIATISAMENKRGLIDDVPVEQVPIEVRVPPGFWQREEAHMPMPLTPMTESTMTADRAFKQACAEHGLLVEPHLASIGGWHYLSMQPVGGKPDAPPPPGWLMPLLLRLSPASRERMRRSKEATRTHFADELVDRWTTKWQPEFERRIAELRDADLAALTVDQFIAHFTAARELADDGTLTHFRVNLANWLALADLATACRDLLGWQQTDVDNLLAGLSPRTSEPARKLAALAGKSEDAPEFTQYARLYGCRSLTVELSNPTIAELPGLARRLLQDQIARGFNPATSAEELARKRAEAAAEARSSLRGRELAWFERALARATKAYPIREDNVFFTIDSPNALLRYAALEAGRRLAHNGQIDTHSDVFFLKADEALAALQGSTGMQTLVVLRKGERQWAIANPGPPSYGHDHGQPDTRWLRSDLRKSTEALLWAAERVLAPKLSNRVTAEPKPATLTGIAGSAGRYRGTARVINSEDEFGKLQAGDVLVCPTTRPSWSILFPSAGAIVTDAGGPLSHPAIIAREYRIPAVVATGFATTTLHDGQVVTVDGARGVVEVEA